jgi:Family of unknown function (DUF5682)
MPALSCSPGWYHHLFTAPDRVIPRCFITVARGAAWIEGFLSGGGLLLVHDQRLLKVVDGWLTDIAGEIVGRSAAPT